MCVEVFNIGKFVGVGRNKRIAKCTAAKRALRALRVIEDTVQQKRAEMLAEQYYFEEMQQNMLNQWQENLNDDQEQNEVEI